MSQHEKAILQPWARDVAIDAARRTLERQLMDWHDMSEEQSIRLIGTVPDDELERLGYSLDSRCRVDCAQGIPREELEKATAEIAMIASQLTRTSTT